MHGQDESLMQTLVYASRSQRIRHFFANAIAFFLCYQTTNYLAHSKPALANVATAIDHHIPFFEWMVVPYLCSGLFFIGSFFIVNTLDDLRVLSQRMLLATVLAALVFAFFPLQFSFAKPSVEHPLFAALFKLLALLDRPYNQLPSLHIAYCVIFWRSLSPRFISPIAKFALAISLLLISISTVFTYQHHALDLLAGLLLGVVCIALVKTNQKQIPVAFYYLMMASIVFIVGLMLLQSWFAAYFMLSLLLVAYAYYAKHRHFLKKHSGRHPWFIWLMYAPYLCAYRITWHLVQHRERHQPAFQQYANQLWVGRRLNTSQLALLPNNLAVIDLSPELSEINPLYLQNYRHFPLLDLIEPESTVIDDIIYAIAVEIAQGHNVYLHCAMGYQRSVTVAEKALLKIAS
jgi:hypothetical protein